MRCQEMSKRHHPARPEGREDLVEAEIVAACQHQRSFTLAIFCFSSTNQLTTRVGPCRPLVLLSCVPTRPCRTVRTKYRNQS